MTPEREFVEDALRDIYRVQASLLPWEWAEQNIILDAEESIDNAGAYDSSLTPWHRFILEFFVNPAWREMWIMKSSQTGVTLCMLLAICYIVSEMPVHLLYAIDSEKEMKRISQVRLKPKLEQVFKNAKIDVDDERVNNLFIHIRGMAIYLLGGGSAGAFGNKTVGVAILDELDKHDEAPGGEASTADLARSRIKKVANGKLVGFSTPKRWMGAIHREYLTGSRHRLYLPCPHCGHYQFLDWKRMQFNHCKDLTGNWDYERLRNETHYLCENETCQEGEHGGRIEEKHKAPMLQQMDPRPTNVNQDDHRRVPMKLSLHVPDLYSTFPGSLWGDLAVEWIGAQKDPSKLQNFWNSRLGEPVPEKKLEIQLPMVAKLRGGYDIGCCPVQPAWSADGHPAIFTASDVQDTVKKMVTGVFRPNGELYIVDYTETLSYADIEAFASQEVACGVQSRNAAGRVMLPGDLGLVDEGHETKEVRSFCLRTQIAAQGHPGPIFFMCKGRGGIQVRDVVSESATQHEGHDMITYHFSDDDFKRELYLGRIGKHDDIAAGTSAIPRLWLPAYADDSFMAELCKERRIQKRVKGRMVWVWDDNIKGNDFGDAVKMLLVLWYRVKETYTLWERPES